MDGTEISQLPNIFIQHGINGSYGPYSSLAVLALNTFKEKKNFCVAIYTNKYSISVSRNLMPFKNSNTPNAKIRRVIC